MLSVASSQSYTQAEVLEMIKQRDAQWEGKLEKADSLIASQKVVISDSDNLIKELESQVRIDSLLLLKKSEQIEEQIEQELGDQDWFIEYKANIDPKEWGIIIDSFLTIPPTLIFLSSTSAKFFISVGDKK